MYNPVALSHSSEMRPNGYLGNILAGLLAVTLKNDVQKREDIG